MVHPHEKNRAAKIINMGAVGLLIVVRVGFVWVHTSSGVLPVKVNPRRVGTPPVLVLYLWSFVGCGAVMRSHDSPRQLAFGLVEEYGACEEKGGQ